MDGGFLINKANVFRETLKGRPRVYERMYILYNISLSLSLSLSVFFFPPNQYFHTCKILFMADSVSKVINVVL